MANARIVGTAAPETTARTAPPVVCPSSSATPVHRLLRAQRTVGNQAVLRSARSGVSSGSSEPEFALPRAGGESLPAVSRALMESRFGEDFSGVRVHADSSSARAARALGATAFTTGSDIYFARGRYQPESTDGRRLLAHELTHVVQQRRTLQSAAFGLAQPYVVSAPHEPDEREATRVAARVASGRAAPRIAATAPLHTADGVRIARLQRQEEFATVPGTVPGGGVTPGQGEGLDVMFIVPTALFTPDIKKYAETVLVPDVVQEIQSVEDLFDHLKFLADNDLKVRRIRIVSHGTPAGIVTLRLKGQATKDRVTPKEIEAVARRESTRAIVKRVMAPGALVEFWGCNVGRSPEGGAAWANLFQSRFQAATGRFITEYHIFRRPARASEKRGTAIAGREGLWVQMTHSSQIDPAEPIYRDFAWWLFNLYEDLVRNGDLAPLEETGTDEERVRRRLAYMTRLFDEAKGDIRSIAVQRKDKTGVHPIRPGDREDWKKMWVTFEPVPLEAVADAKAAVAPEPPPLPTDIVVREPSDPSAFIGPSVSSPLTMTPPPVRQRPADAPMACRRPDSDPTGSIFERVHFASDHADTAGGSDELARFLALLGPQRQTGPVRVDGYASTDGDDDYNLRLSCRRAQSVRDELIRAGVPASHITTYAHGETTEFSAKNRAENRVAIVSASTSAAPEHTAVTPAGPLQGGAKATPGHARDDPHFLLTGKHAAAAVARILPTARPITLATSTGYVRLVPGTVWDNHKLLVYASDWIVYYTVGHNLYESSPSTFLRTFWFDALARGVASASYWTTVAKVEIALLEGIFVPWYLLAAPSVAVALVSYAAHPDRVHAGVRQAVRVIQLLWDFRGRYPRLFDRIAWSVGKEVLADLPKGVEAEDIAFFIGRLFHIDWVRGFTEGGLLVENLTVKKFAKVVATTALLVAGAHLPKIAKHGVEAALDQRVEEWRAAMAAEGVTMSEEEARVLLRELAAHPDSAQRLQTLQAALQDLLPAVEALAKSMRMY